MKITQSRNKREGRYTGKVHKRHRRSTDEIGVLSESLVKRYCTGRGVHWYSTWAIGHYKGLYHPSIPK